MLKADILQANLFGKGNLMVVSIFSISKYLTYLVGFSGFKIELKGLKCCIYLIKSTKSYKWPETSDFRRET